MKMLKKFFFFMTVIFILLFSTTFAKEYEGTAKGYHGNISVKVNLGKDNKIQAIHIGKTQETKGIGDVAEKKIPEWIIKQQSLNIDTISGATITSNAIIEAVADALQKSGLDLKEYHYSIKEKELQEMMIPIKAEAMPKKKAVTKKIMITDAKGRKVELGLPISSYAISTMDVIDYIIPLKGKEAFSMLVGSGQDGGRGLHKYAKLYTPIVGNYMTHTGQISDHNAPFDLEMILSMQPDVLIVNSAMAAHKYALEIEEILKNAGIQIVLIDVPGKQLEKSIPQTMKILGQIFQEERKAKEVSDFIEKQYSLIASKKVQEKTKKPTVYYEKSGYSEIIGSTSTSKTGWGMLIKLAGGENIADKLLINTPAGKGSGNKLDPEYILESNPDFIIISGVNDGWLSKVSPKKQFKFDIVHRNGWKNLNAVKKKRIYEFAHSTNRSIYAFYPSLKIAKILYPEDFKDVQPEKILDEFFKKFMLLDSSISTWFYELKDAEK
ncbi:FMN-binding protein [Fusobacterium necrophorum DAB]|uniref:ABC transporter substrate-binding protein n=1 Tax=Fusobacterium necrophorum TaxID=859 RepID=UPI0004616846|nr:ABC transporter substrate-binding protein [Fusobacterium necrophorum]KDE71248.1 FMN-binding protein [Fusobacterium necrophorum DAB]